METESINLYAVLELDKSATPEDIKKSYRRLALRYHPDKNPNCEDQFKSVNYAYEILSDAQKKRIYDRYGIVGLNMADNMGGAMFLDPEVEAIVLAFFCLVSIMIVAILVWLVFICLKVDRSVTWSWSIVFIPLWIVNASALWITFYRVRHYEPHKQQPQDEPTEEDGLLGTPRKQDRINQFLPFVNCCLLVLFQIFIVTSLDGVIHWPVITVFIPFYAYELVNSVLVGKKGWVTRLVWILQVTSIVVQLVYIKRGYSWSLVFIPLYALGIYFGYKLWKQYHFFKNLARQEAQQGKLLIIVASIIYGILAVLLYTVLGFVIARLDGASHVRLSLILIPVFILLSIVLCCTGCCLPCMLVVSSLPINEEEQLIDPNRRITEQQSSRS